MKPASSGGRPRDLLERDRELGAVDDALRAALAGSGTMTLFEGPPGIGKSALVGACVARARDRGMRVLVARAGELELAFPYAVLRQLFEQVLTAADGPLRGRLLAGAAAHAETVADPRAAPPPLPLEPSAVLHSLYWLTANLAAEGPLVIVVDDLHWCDPASVSWLVYLARRVEDLPLALVLGARPVEPGAGEKLLDGLRAVDGMQRVEPAPLSPAAVDDLARGALGELVEREFSEVCHSATGGNPFYVAELLRALREDRVAGTTESVPAIDGLTPRAVVHATLARLGRMPSAARTVAEAVALLEPAADLRWIAGLTALHADVAAGAADALLEAGLLRSVAPCRFEHPILRAAVESEIAPARRGRLHLKAARMLEAAGLPAEPVASHLLRSEPCGEPWVVSVLRQAALRASARGAPGGAAGYLERALAERPPADERRTLLTLLGTAESQAQMPHAIEHLREALALAADPDEAAKVGLALGQALFNAGEIDESYATANAVLTQIDGHQSDPALVLETYLLTVAGPAGRMSETAARRASIEARTPDGSPAAGAVQGSLALRDLVTGVPREQVRARAERAVEALGRDFGWGQAALGRDAPGMAFLWTDDLDRADALFTAAVDDASRMGRIRSFETFSALRGYTARRRGELDEASADIMPVVTGVARGETPRAAALVALVTQVLLLVDRDQAAAAEGLAAFAPIPPAFERQPIVALLRHAHGAAQLAQRRFSEAAETLTRVGEVCERSGIHSPAMIPWRSELALALAGGERHDEALELAHAELLLAERCDVDRARGVALRALGLLEGGEPGLARLAAAVHALERSQSRLELGWACYEHGAALRRARRRRAARDPLDRALDIAVASGAHRLAAGCREELSALGARPRSVMLSGAEALTPSERRVCRMAADGLRNSEIAQALFVSLKTVETHLSSSYRKLDIGTRGALAAALEPAA